MRCCLLLSICALSLASAEPLRWPDGYANARTATDPEKPQVIAQERELRLAATHLSIGIEWDLEGDTDHDAACSVSYRVQGTGGWAEAMPLFRVDYEGWYEKAKAERPFNMLAGSVLFLEPGAEYEVKLSLRDPDNPTGTERVERVRTKPWPDLHPLRTLFVSAEGGGGGDGSAGNPIQGLKAALHGAKPGDLFLLLPGNYGDAVFAVSGEGGTPGSGSDSAEYIGFRSAEPGLATFTQIRTRGNHLWFEGLRLARGESPNGLRADGPCENVVVKRCAFRDFHYSIFLNGECRGWHIADNDFVGDTTEGISGECVELNHSSLHTVCYNRMDRSADGVSYPERGCDIFGNDIVNMSDDPVEPDYGYANNRIWGNRLHGHTALSFQPMYCGPWYFVRNHCISRGNVLKLRVQDRFVCVNNTFAAFGTALPHAHGLLSSFCRNNLWIHLGGSEMLWAVWASAAEKDRAYNTRFVVYDSPVANWKTDVDYDGFEFSEADLNSKENRRNPWVWLGERYFDLTAFRSSVGVERHGLILDRSRDFAPFALRRETPGETTPLIRLSEGSAAKDAGIPVANLADHFEGNSPDLGALEWGSELPHYGPRGQEGPPAEWITARRDAMRSQDSDPSDSAKR